MKFKVPQKIDIEDKIVGPLTMKQFVYLLVGGMISYTTIKMANIAAIIFIGVPVALISLCLAFVKIQDQSFSKFLFSLVLFVIKPRNRAWVKQWQTEGVTTFVVHPQENTNIIRHEAKHVKQSDLEKLSKILDMRGRPKTNNS